MKKLFILIFISFGIQSSSYAQAEVIKLENPSFEGKPHIGKRAKEGVKQDSIKGWANSAALQFPRQSPPDLHIGISQDTSIASEIFGVKQMASDGKTYLGLVTRKNDTWESVLQQLATPLISGKCYGFSIDLSRSPDYISPLPKNEKSEKFIKPITLRIYGATSQNGKRELLAKSDEVKNTDWENYSFTFQPSENHTYFYLSAFYKVPALMPYNGNLLLDNASEIMLIDCKN